MSDPAPSGPASSPAAAPPPRTSPLHHLHEAAGATFTEFGGWTMPVRYTSELTEHAAVRTAAGLFDLSHMGEILVLGPEAAAALDAALLGELSAVAIGQARYTLLLNPEGGIVDDLVAYRTGPDRFLVVANAANRVEVAAALRERAVGFDAQVQDETDDIGLIALQGPKALEVLLEIDGFAADQADRTEAAFRELLPTVRNYRFIAAWWDGHPVLVARTGYTGENGYELYAAPGLLERLWTIILEVGAGSGVVPVGLAARDTLRLEAGMPLYGHELTALTRPQHAGLGRLIKPGKAADYVGRAAVEAPEAGEGRVLVGLVSEGRRAGRAGYRVLTGDPSTGSGHRREVGVVTSGALSPTLGRPIAMAYVDPAALDADLAIDVRGTPLPATITPSRSCHERPEMAREHDLQYTAEHEWVEAAGDTVTVGITAYAAGRLGDIVFVELPEVGSDVTAGQVIGELESTKSVGELFSPVSGTITAVNDELSATPEAVNSDPYGAGWLLKVQVTELPELLDHAAYEQLTGAA